MAFFLVDLEFREKARQLITSKEMWFAIFFAIFALVSLSEVLYLLVYDGHGILPKSNDPYAALNALVVSWSEVLDDAEIEGKAGLLGGRSGRASRGPVRGIEHNILTS